MNLTDAIEELEAMRLGENLIATSFHYATPATAQRAKRTSEALDLAIAILSEQATVAPARRTDPATSHRAAPEEIKAGSAREKILMTYYDFGIATARTACQRAGFDLGVGSPWKRVSELKQAGFLRVVGESEAGRETYLITEKGRAAAKEIASR